MFRRSGFVAYITLMCVSVAGILLLVSAGIARSYLYLQRPVQSHIMEFSIRRRQRHGPIHLLDDEDDSYQDSLGSSNPSPSARSAIPFVERNRSDQSPGSPIFQVNREDRHVRIVLPSDAGSDDGGNEQSRVNKDTKPDKSLILVGMSYAACSGTLSGLSLLFAKCGVELLVITFASGGRENQFKSIQSWILLAGLGITALAQLFYLNHSLRLAGPALICPLAFCFYNISSIFGVCSPLSGMSLKLTVGRYRWPGILFPILRALSSADLACHMWNSRLAHRRMVSIRHRTDNW